MSVKSSLVASLMLLVVLPLSRAQDYPVKPIHAIVPVGPGTPTDLVARAVGQSLLPTLGQPVVVDNRAGASGIIGTEACARAMPDGYSLCFVANGQISLNPFVFAKLPYDPPRDFAPIVRVADIVSGIAVNASLPVDSLRDLVELSKSKPGTINWSSWGIGTPSHLFMGWLENRMGASFVHVPYKEPGQAWNAILSGEAHAIAQTTGLIAPMVKAGKIKALAVGASRRSGFLPDVPTFKELGLNLQFGGWIGLLAPTGTPKDAIQRLNIEINKLLGDQKFIEKAILPVGLEPAGGTSEEFAAFLKTDRDIGAELVRLANVRPQ
jgi:tripartite-type tricarboxylate transporter receptor subunit TctC